MTMNRGAYRLGAALVWLIAPLVFNADAAESPTGVKIDGDVRQNLRVNVEDLRDLASSVGVNARIARRSGDTTVASSLSGVRLSALIDRAGLSIDDPHQLEHTVVIATGGDGHRVVFSWPELTNTEAGAHVLVAITIDGAPLRDDDGPIALYAPQDLRAESRHVRALKRLQVKVIGD